MMFNIPEIELTDKNIFALTVYIPSVKDQDIHLLWESLSQEEKKQAEMFHGLSLKNMYVVSHGILRQALSFYTNTPHKEISYGFNSFGKPFLKGNHSNLQFNMSHSGEYAIYAFALNCEVGVDIERHFDL